MKLDIFQKKEQAKFYNRNWKGNMSNMSVSNLSVVALAWPSAGESADIMITDFRSWIYIEVTLDELIFYLIMCVLN